jgi:CheY-like chemotaxis protein
VQGIALFTTHQKDIKVVLTDMMMPLMDGAATVRALQELEPGVRIIGSSGLNSPESAGLADLRIQGFLQKPYSARTLLEAVHEVLTK